MASGLIERVPPLLLDTSALLYWTLSPARLTPAAQSAIDDAAQTGIAASAISLWEIGLKVQRGTLQLGVDFDEYVSRLHRVHNLAFIAVDTKIWLRLLALTWDHRDPADRVIVATADVLDTALVTSDRAIRDYFARSIWD